MTINKTFILHEGQVYPHYYLCNYLPWSMGSDKLSQSLLNFKAGCQPDLGIWIDRASTCCARMEILPGTLVIRALHHDETMADPYGETPLDQLGLGLARSLGGIWTPGFLRKTGPAEMVKGLPAGDRERVLRDIYYIGMTPPIRSYPLRILLIDDILSTGSTARAILRAISGYVSPVDLTLFTLGRIAPCGNK